MPLLSDTMKEGVIAEWHKKVGDKVKFVVKRKNAEGEEKEVNLEADIREETENYIFIEVNKELNASQERMRAAWLAK